MKHLVVFLLFWGLAPAALATPVDSRGQTVPVRDLAVLVDAEGSEGIASVATPTAPFTPLLGMLNAGYSRKVFWLRFTVQAPAAGLWWLEVEPPFLDDLRLFEPTGQGFREHRTGDLMPFSSRDVNYRAFVFKLELPDTTPHTFYLRLQSSSSVLASMRLWQPEAFHAAANQEYAIYGFYLGLVVLVLLLNLTFWLWLREALYGWFSLNVFANILLFIGANGFASQYLLPNAPGLANAWLGLSVLFAIAVWAPFYRRILRVERDQPFALAAFRLLAVVPVLLMPTVFSGHYPQVAPFVLLQMLLTLLLGLWLAWRLWRANRHEAPFVLFALTVSVLGSFTSVLVVLGVNPGHVFSFNLRQLTVLSNILAMHFALVVRIRAMRAERQQILQRAWGAEADAARERQTAVEQQRFIAMLSHELKTPLSVIDAATQALERMDRQQDSARARRYDRIRRSVNRIDRLVEQFLTKDRLDSEAMALQRGPVDLGGLLRQVADTTADGAERLRLQVSAQPPLLADGSLLRLAIANLVDNALKYGPADTMVTLAITTREENGRPGVDITVADEGPGVPPQLRERLFSRYVRGDDVQHLPGAGLGLYVVRRIAELHGGRAGLLPRAVGSVFHIWLPLDGGESA